MLFKRIYFSQLLRSHSMIITQDNHSPASQWLLWEEFWYEQNFQKSISLTTHSHPKKVNKSHGLEAVQLLVQCHWCWMSSSLEHLSV